MKYLASLMVFFSLFAQGQEQSCNISFSYGVIIDPSHIRFVKHGQTQIQINNEHQLFIHGREQTLDDKQKQLLSSYAAGLREQIPEIVDIALESAEMGLKTVDKIVGTLTGENSRAHQKVQKQFEELHWRLRMRFNHSDNSYYLAPQDLDSFDQIFAGEFEAQIEEVISESLGTILLAVGANLSEQNDENSEERISTMDERIDTLTEDIDAEVSQKARRIELKAQQFCYELNELNMLEFELHQNMPALAEFDLINVQ
ncbi:DUF2884 family protein [Thalassotalea agarivorans]|uniref:DUF2884 family protein n=1 Tax=Thalassotalea agarivorans TaxID=349064 RepID=A0A1I0HIA9_THASX|nr:DUF2884 family protein [Thalassotalea agarivorans]SET83550.1 Protein of unknown function [Thalassotalea agarivorans]